MFWRLEDVDRLCTFSKGMLQCSGVLKWWKMELGMWRRLQDRCHLTLSVQCLRQCCLKGRSPAGKQYHQSPRNSSSSGSKFWWWAIAETQMLKIDFCRHWGIQMGFLYTVNTLPHHISCFLMWKYFWYYRSAEGLKLVFAWITLGHAGRRYFPDLSISSRPINAFP